MKASEPPSSLLIFEMRGAIAWNATPHLRFLRRNLQTVIPVAAAPLRVQCNL
jgi:hypothetical protein